MNDASQTGQEYCWGCGVKIHPAIPGEAPEAVDGEEHSPDCEAEMK